MASARPAACTCGHSFSAHNAGRGHTCSFCGCEKFEDAILASVSPQALAAVDLLANHPALKGVPAEQLIALAESGQRRLFLEGKVLMAQDAANQSLHILVKGRVRVDRIANGKNELIGRLGPGDLIGDMGVLNGTPRLATVTAIDDVETLELGEEVLRGVFQQHSALLLAMMRLVHDRLESKKA